MAVSEVQRPLATSDIGARSWLSPSKTAFDGVRRCRKLFGPAWRIILRAAGWVCGRRGLIQMKTWKKVGIGVAAAAVLGGVVWVSVKQANKGVVTVQTGKVGRQDLTSVVTASGEVKPWTYTNVYAEGFGKIVQIVVKEGAHVKKGDVLLRLENIQPTADVDAQRAALESAEAAIKSAEASYRSAQADLTQRKAD